MENSFALHFLSGGLLFQVRGSVSSFVQCPILFGRLIVMADCQTNHLLWKQCLDVENVCTAVIFISLDSSMELILTLHRHRSCCEMLFFSAMYGSPGCRILVLQHSQLSGEHQHPPLECFGHLTESKKMFISEMFLFVLIASK